MGKRRYRAIGVQEVSSDGLRRRFEDGRVIVAIDVAKEKFVAGLADGAGKVVQFVKWRHPEETRVFLDLVVRLKELSLEVEAALEPTATYGDAVRWNLEQLEIPVFRACANRTYLASELHDGVPSWHDAKSASVIAEMHAEGKTQRWRYESEARRSNRSWTRRYSLHDDVFDAHGRRMEQLLARHWPELAHHLRPRSATMLRLLARYGGPAGVAEAPIEARELLASVSRRRLPDTAIHGAVASARQTLGVPTNEAEREHVRALAEEMLRLLEQINRAHKALKEKVEQTPSTQRIRSMVGARTAAVLVGDLGELGEYSSSGALVKALGLNLTEKSSGRHQGRHSISKRGPGRARRYIYLLALRLILRDRWVRGWYEARCKRDIPKRKTIVALMRKVTRALWHVARGAEFDSMKLFDTRRFEPIEVRAPGFHRHGVAYTSVDVGFSQS